MILDQIMAVARRRVAEEKLQANFAELEEACRQVKTHYDFYQALATGEGIKLIAEIKRASPSKGWLRAELDPTELANSYAKGGARAISVLTEPTFFHGSLADLAEVRQRATLPLLDKDFIFDPYQVYQACLSGADAILLIAATLPQTELAELIQLAHQCSMTALVEVHNEAEVAMSLASGAKIIGINNRNLSDFTVDLNITRRLRPLIPPEIIVVSESGIHNNQDIQLLEDVGVDAVLIGEALVTSPDPETKVREILSANCRDR
jgi:indole-3-glycerol phosphate synthase